MLCVFLSGAGVFGVGVLFVYLTHAGLKVCVFVVHAPEENGLVSEDVEEWVEVFSARIYRKQSGEAAAGGVSADCVGNGSAEGGECCFRNVGGFSGVKGFA